MYGFLIHNCTCRSSNNLRRESTETLTGDSTLVRSSGRSSKNETVCEVDPLEHDAEYMRIYIVFIAVFVFLNVVSSATFCVILARASQRIHDFMFTRMLRVVTKFFDDHPSGRIINPSSRR